MTNKKLLTALMTVTLSTTLMACGNDANKEVENKNVTETLEEAETVKEAVENDTKEASENEEVTEGVETEGESDIYALDFGYLPESFVENFKDEKTDLRTVEYIAEKNPAQKIQIQISDNEERFGELVTVPDDAEDVTVGSDPAKFWDDGSFRYLVTTKGAHHIYARSTLDKDETIKVVEEIK